MRGISKLLVLAAFFTALHWPRLAFADVTITGTVGEVGVILTILNGGSNVNVVRFKMTDPNQTATCTDQIGAGTTTKYAFVVPGSPMLKEIYAALLYSKKGAPITCTILSATNCQVTSCTLP